MKNSIFTPSRDSQSEPVFRVFFEGWDNILFEGTFEEVNDFFEENAIRPFNSSETKYEISIA